MICNGSMAFPVDWHELILDKTGIDSMRSVPLINRFAYALIS